MNPDMIKNLLESLMNCEALSNWCSRESTCECIANEQKNKHKSFDIKGWR